MKIQCDSCEAGEANVLCCADKAALCLNCDQKVHAANKLASKHQRVPLFSSLSQMPKCDICQETEGYFFCLEDRALLCRKCDVTIHTGNSLVSTHQRFLLTGVKVGLEATEPSPSCLWKTRSSQKISETEPRSISKQMALVPSNGLHNKSVPIQAGLGDHFSSPELSFAGGVATGDVSQWPLEDFLGLGDINPNYNFCIDILKRSDLVFAVPFGESLAIRANAKYIYKADGGKLGDSDSSPAVRAADGILGGAECMDLVPDAFWAVPQIAYRTQHLGFTGLKMTRIHWTTQSRSPKYAPHSCRISILINIKETLLAQSERGSSNVSFDHVSPISSCLEV